MIHNLIRAAHELIFNRKISNMNSNTVQGAIDELKGTLGYTKKNHFKYITDGFEYNGIVAQKNSDGSMTVSGTATDNVDYQIGVDIYPENEQYILSGYTEGADADCNIYAAYWEDASTWKSAEAVLDDKGVLVTKAKGNLCKVCLHVASGKTVNIKFYPMVRYASVKDGSFEQHVEDVQTQINNIKTNTYEILLDGNYDVSSSTQTIVIPNYQNYNMLSIRIQGDTNNGIRINIPKALYNSSTPFYIECNHRSEGAYMIKAQGNIYKGVITIIFSSIKGWTKLNLLVLGLN